MTAFSTHWQTIYTAPLAVHRNQPCERIIVAIAWSVKNRTKELSDSSSTKMTRALPKTVCPRKTRTHAPEQCPVHPWTQQALPSVACLYSAQGGHSYYTPLLRWRLTCKWHCDITTPSHAGRRSVFIHTSRDILASPEMPIQMLVYSERRMSQLWILRNFATMPIQTYQNAFFSSYSRVSLRQRIPVLPTASGPFPG